jgi:hypothetical protein
VRPRAPAGALLALGRYHKPELIAARELPLPNVKRTCFSHRGMSPKCQYRSFAHAVGINRVGPRAAGPLWNEKTRIADIWLRYRLRGKKPSKSEEKVEPDRCF